jgi:hypothetical protein
MIRDTVCAQENMLQDDGSEVEEGSSNLNFSVVKRFRVDINPRWMSLSPTEETLMCCSAAGDVGKLTFANLNDSEPFFELLCSGFHHGAVTDMDVCTGRPLLVSSGADQTVRATICSRWYTHDAFDSPPGGGARVSGRANAPSWVYRSTARPCFGTPAAAARAARLTHCKRRMPTLEHL